MTTLCSPTRLAAGLLVALFPTLAAGAGSNGLYERAGWVAEIPPGAHDAQGVATIIDARTIHVEHFTYDGTAPAVYFTLGATNTNGAFTVGLDLEPMLDRPYADETLTLVLPEGETLDGYGAISVWCDQFNANFSSASFAPPAGTYDRAGWAADLPPGAHDAQGVATIINERIIFVEHFTYDGTAPAVYFYLGATDSHADFVNGLELAGQLDRPYADESLVRTLPDGENLDGWGAISVWCALVDANFSSAAFEPPVAPCPEDIDGDGDIGFADLLTVLSTWGPCPGCAADIDDDDIVGFSDLLLVLSSWGPCP